MLHDLQTEMLFNTDGSINYDVAESRLGSVILPHMTLLNKETVILESASGTVLSEKVLEKYFERLPFAKMILNNRIPFELVIQHRQYIIDQLLRSLIYDMDTYTEQYTTNKNLQQFKKLVLVRQFIQQFDQQDAIFEDIFMELYSELKDLYLIGYHQNMTTPGEFLHFSNRHMTKLFHFGFMYHHRFLFDPVDILTWYPHYHTLHESWMVANWITDRDLKHAIRVLLRDYRKRQRAGESTSSPVMQDMSRRLFYIKRMIHDRKMNN